MRSATNVNRGPRRLAVAAAVAAVLAAHLAAAQQQQGNAQQDNTQQQGENAGGLEEIVVTARFREENLQQTPLAITAFTADTLTERGVTDVEDVGAVIPNAYFRPNGGTPIIGMRGKINSETLSFSKPTVAVYTDGVYWARQVGMNFTLFDLERVEVLRGPQGTLFGKNALGGAVNLVTKQPQGDGTGYLEASYGNYNAVEIKGAMDFAIRDNLFARVTGMSEKRDGYIDVLDYACQMMKEGRPEMAGYGDGIVGMEPAGTASFGGPQVQLYRPVFGTPGSAADNAFAMPFVIDNDKLTRVNSCKIGTQRGKDVQGARIQLRWLPTEDLDIVLSVDEIDDNSEAWGNVTRKQDAGINALQRAYLNNYIMRHAGIGADKVLAGAWYRDPKSFETFETWIDPHTGEIHDVGEQISNKGYSLRLAYDIGENMVLNYLGAYRELDTSLTASAGFPGMGDPYDLHNQVIWQHHEQMQHEVRLEGTALAGTVDWTVGAFYFDTDEYELLKTDISEQEWAGLFEIRHDDTFWTENKSAFGHVVWRMTDGLALTAGIRYTEEVNDILFRHPPNLIAQEVLSADAQRWDWKVGADWKFGGEQMVYGTVATGFRSKGFQARPFTPAQVNDVYMPYPQEEVLSYELGYKVDFFDGRVRTNFAAFLDDYDPRVTGEAGIRQCSAYNAKEPPYPYRPNELIDSNGDGVGDLCPPGTDMAGTQGFGYTFNISAPAEVRGVEFEASANPFGQLLISASFGYNEFESKITTPGRPGYIHPDVIIQPKYNASAGVQYAFAFGSGAVLTPRIDWSYQGRRTVGSLSVQPQPDQFLPGYSLFNARVTYQTGSGDWQASLGATNLFNKFYFYNFESGSGWGVMGSPGAPRMWTLSLRRNF